MVFAFMAKHKQPVMRYPSIVPPELAQFRIRLIEEELNELRVACGFAPLDMSSARVLERPSNQTNLVDIADALADIKYVVFGTDITFGLPCDSIFEEVHRSNMSKSLIRVEGNEQKVGKGPSYVAPQIKSILDAWIRIGEANDRDRNEQRGEAEVQGKG
jgi:predicted HAD superfamily Cof-like phosphohydrolase